MLSRTSVKAVPASAVLLENVRSQDTVILDAYATIAEMLFPVKLHPLTCSVDERSIITAGRLLVYAVLDTLGKETLVKEVL